MRIVGGIWRGRSLEAPAGRGTTRPTTDRNREAVASMLLAACGLDLSGVRVLDAFAGSGAMGLELLSRGAAHATFVEADAKVASLVRRNVAACGAQRSSDVVRGDVLRLAEAGRLPGGPFGIVFLDPPYAMDAGEVSGLVRSLAASGLLAQPALVCYERSSDAAGLDLEGDADACRARIVRTKRHGATSVDLLLLGENDGDEMH
jgi:16S rRNA (guanine966-N2)-methyltransferase